MANLKLDSEKVGKTQTMMSIDEVKILKSIDEFNFKKKKIYVSTKLPLSRSSSQYEKFETFSSHTNDNK